ncbi:MAG: hypothetical protein HY811_01085 [Planctomycetes bacterium]|nr:hypothetical protein [Planctomycetota bacterium]
MEPKKAKQGLNPEPASPLGGCEQYSLDIVDLATGESAFVGKERREEVLRHLVDCAPCRQAFKDYENIYATSVTEEYSKTPEFQKKKEDLVALLKKGSFAAKKPSPFVVKIVKHADMIYSYLPENGKPMPLPELETKSKLPSDDLHDAIGWLVCKEWINITENEQVHRV